MHYVIVVESVKKHSDLSRNRVMLVQPSVAVSDHPTVDLKFALIQDFPKVSKPR